MKFAKENITALNPILGGVIYVRWPWGKGGGGVKLP